MPALAILLRALLARYGAELVYQTLQLVRSSPQQVEQRELNAVIDCEVALVGGLSELIRRDVEHVDRLSRMDFEDRGYVWDSPCAPEEE